ncbi:MAG TPA: hypothetical protein VHL11_01985, partial [Phototrophicaceae bacterium]|nr:hypothetical protein [Phototrophicaceae bacterium]
LGAIISLVITLLILNLFKTDPARKQELAPVRVLGIGLIVMIVLEVVFTVLVSAISGAATWLFVPAGPVIQNLPLLNAIFLTPFVMDLIFNPGRTPQEAARFVITPAVMFNVLYTVFYGAAIGLVLPLEPARTAVSALNVVVIVLLVLYTGEVLWSLGKFAAGIVWVLRHVPQFLGQK